MIERKIEGLVQALPFNLKREVLDYVEFLTGKCRKKVSPGKKKFKFDWEGGLGGIESGMTSVELQHKAMDWR